MTPTEVTTILRQFNEWRWGDEGIPQPDPCEIGEAIDAAVEIIERMEKHLLLILEEPENELNSGAAEGGPAGMEG